MDWRELGCQNVEKSLMTPNAFLGNLMKMAAFTERKKFPSNSLIGGPMAN